MSSLALVMMGASCASSPKSKDAVPETQTSETPTPAAASEAYGPVNQPIPDPVLIPDAIPTMLPGPLTLIVGPGLSRAGALTGFLRVLEEEKIPVEKIVGVEAGALMAGIYTLSENQNKVDWLSQKFSKDDFTGSASGLLKKLEAALQKKELSQARIPLVLMAFCNSQLVKIDRGNAARALRAAVSNSEVMDPFDWEGQRCISSEKESPFPVDELRELLRNSSKHPIVVLDFLEASSVEPGRLDAYFTKVRDLGAKERDHADLVIRPLLKTEFLDFTKPGDAVYIGKKAARANLDELKRLTTPVVTATEGAAP